MPPSRWLLCCRESQQSATPHSTLHWRHHMKRLESFAPPPLVPAIYGCLSDTNMTFKYFKVFSWATLRRTYKRKTWRPLFGLLFDRSCSVGWSHWIQVPKSLGRCACASLAPQRLGGAAKGSKPSFQMCPVFSVFPLPSDFPSLKEGKRWQMAKAKRMLGTPLPKQLLLYATEGNMWAKCRKRCLSDSRSAEGHAIQHWD